MVGFLRLHEKRGSKNFVKERHCYVYDEIKLNKVKEKIIDFVNGRQVL